MPCTCKQGSQSGTVGAEQPATIREAVTAMLRIMIVLAAGTLLTLETQPLEVQPDSSAPTDPLRIATAEAVSGG